MLIFFGLNSAKPPLKTMKAKLYVAPVLRMPNWDLPFHISTDAFNTAIGGLL
jgi:hypothetical protein